MSLVSSAESRKSFRRKLYSDLGAFYGYWERDNIGRRHQLDHADVHLEEYEFTGRRDTHPNIKGSFPHGGSHFKEVDEYDERPKGRKGSSSSEESLAPDQDPDMPDFDTRSGKVRFGKDKIGVSRPEDGKAYEATVPAYKAAGPSTSHTRDSTEIPAGKNPADALKEMEMQKKLARYG